MSGLWAGQPESVSYSGWTPAFKCPSDLGQEASSVIHSSSEVLGHGHCRDPTPNNLAPSYYAVLAGPLFDHCEPPSRAQLPSAPSKEGAPSTSLWVSKGVALGLPRSVVQCCSVLSAPRQTPVEGPPESAPGTLGVGTPQPGSPSFSGGPIARRGAVGCHVLPPLGLL